MKPLVSSQNRIADLADLEPYLSGKIIGQEHVISRVCSVLERTILGLNPDDKPLGSFLFLGPTGVGKTELTIELTRFFFGDDALFRFDMSEFQHEDSVKMFLGDEKGRVGRLGQVLAAHHKGVLLFDETEKSHRLIWDLFLQMTDAARITLADHHTYDLSGFLLVFTSNIGSQSLLRPTRLPFTTLERAVLAELHKVFRPELIGRFDEKIVFKPLTQESQRRIAEVKISDELSRVALKGYRLSVESSVIEFLIRRGIHKTLGARPLKKTVQRFIGDAVSHAIRAGSSSSGMLVVSLTHDRLYIK